MKPASGCHTKHKEDQYIWTKIKENYLVNECFFFLVATTNTAASETARVANTTIIENSGASGADTAAGCVAVGSLDDDWVGLLVGENGATVAFAGE